MNLDQTGPTKPLSSSSTTTSLRCFWCQWHCLCTYHERLSIHERPGNHIRHHSYHNILSGVCVRLLYGDVFRGWVCSISTWNDSNKRFYIIFYIASMIHRYWPQLSGVGNISNTASYAILFSGGDFMPLCRGGVIQWDLWWAQIPCAKKYFVRDILPWPGTRPHP